jgi:carnitine-CoA ligase
VIDPSVGGSAVAPGGDRLPPSMSELGGRLPYSKRMPFELFLDVGPTASGTIVDAATGAVHTYPEIIERAASVAAVLRSVGVAGGDHVAWSAPTGVDAVSIWMGIALAGAIDVAIGDTLKGPLLEYMLDDCAPRVLVTHDEAPGGLGGLDTRSLARFDAVLRVGSGEHERLPNAIDLDLNDIDRPISVDRAATSGVSPEQVATVIYTSGTTGPSKGVMLSHHHKFFAGANFAEQFRVRRGAVLYHYSPFNHVTGRQLVVAALLTDSTLVMRSRFRPATFWSDVGAYEVTHAITLGSAVPLLMDHAAQSGMGSSGSLEYIWASPAMPVLYAEFAERFGLRVVSPYGSTEVGIVVAPAVIPDAPGPPGNSGRVSDYYEMAVVDDRDRILPPGEIGEIVVRPKIPSTTFVGYLNKPDATLDATRNLWYHTGDLGRIDADEFLFFVDRKQDFIRTKGENVSSWELENILLRNPAVVECAVVPVKSELADFDILVVLLASGGGVQFDCEGFYEWCAAEVPHFMVPRYVRVVDDMPRGQSGKVEKHKLRQEGVAVDTWDAVTNGLRATRRGIVRTSGRGFRRG